MPIWRGLLRSSANGSEMRRSYPQALEQNLTTVRPFTPALATSPSHQAPSTDRQQACLARAARIWRMVQGVAPGRAAHLIDGGCGPSPGMPALTILEGCKDARPL